ncbi:glucosyltransferase [filamentous cyanobacterium CCP5]|nr:glucosyltransferase [filamentous cyanobacterium CCP5]
MDCHRAAPVPIQRRRPSAGTRRDIRAPRRLRLEDFLSWRAQRSLVLVLSDCFALALAWQIARLLNQYFSPIPAQLVWWTWLGLPSLFWVFTAFTLAVFAHNGLYGPINQVKNYVQAGKLVSLVYLFSLVVVYIYDPKLDPPRSLFFTAWLSSVALVILVRLLVTRVMRPLERAHAQTKIFLIAPATRIRRLSDVIARRSAHPVVGAALAATANSPATFQAILDSGAQQVLADNLPAVDLASSLYWKLRRAGISLQLLPNSREMLYRRGQPEVLAGIPILRLEAPLIGGWDYRIKRWVDVIGSLLGLVILSPLLVGIAIAIRLDSPGPVFFRQERVGLHGRSFRIWKFRTMAVDAAQHQLMMERRNETADGILFKIKRDPRVTRVGHFLRYTSLDELPQLINVLLGQMSLVGPRPLPLRDVARFESWHHVRHQVLPGITGLWQISGRSDIETFDDAARLDLHYIDNWSLNLDLEILLDTFRIVCLRQGAY